MAGRSRHAHVGDFKPCNCKNSKCLKLYCECFASGRYCGACNCLNCMNNRDHEAARSKAIETILERNPNAFRPKIQVQAVNGGVITAQVTRHSKGCSCRKSNCLKKYCECFQAGIFCAQTCRCKDCRNFEGSSHLMQVMATMDATASRQAPTIMMPDPKRVRAGVRFAPAAHAVPPAAAPQPAPRRRDPAREAIKNSRDKQMHEVLANMLTTLHMEALSKEQGRLASQSDVALREDASGLCPSQGVDATVEAPNVNNGLAANASGQASSMDETHLSNYYIRTEGILLAEFGDFLGKFADRVDQAARASDS